MKVREFDNVYKPLLIIAIVVIGIMTSILVVQSSVLISLQEKNEILEEELSEVHDLNRYGMYFIQNIDYEVQYNTILRHYNVRIPFSTYFKYRFEKSHYVNSSSPDSHLRSIENLCNSSSIEKIASDIKKSCVNSNDDEEIIDAILNFVQDRGQLQPSIHYMGGTPYLSKYPIETLAEGNVNCIDKSILFVSLLESLNYDTILIKENTGHFLAGVYMTSPPIHSSTGES